jgi:hypothetical protein
VPSKSLPTLAELLAHFLAIACDSADEDWPTSAELARLFNVKQEWMKKQLKHLQADDLIAPISVSPKRYRFSHYTWKHLDDDHDLKRLPQQPNDD